MAAWTAIVEAIELMAVLMGVGLLGLARGLVIEGRKRGAAY